MYETQAILEETSLTPGSTEVRPCVQEPRLAGSADNVRLFARQLHDEDRHLLSAHWVAGAEQARSTTPRDSPPKELLDVRAEWAAGRHVAEDFGTRHAGGDLDIRTYG